MVTPTNTHNPAPTPAPTRGRAAVMTAAGGPIEVHDLPVPPVGPGEIGLKVQLTGVCGTDAHAYLGHLPTVAFPAVLGHEIVGEVFALGDGVATDYAGKTLAVGDRVGMLTASSCGKCVECAVHHSPSRCPHKQPSYGFNTPMVPGAPAQGGFSEYLVLRPGTSVFRTEAPVETAALIEPMSVAVHGVDRARVRTGSTVVVQGVGAIGLMAIVAARAAGAATVIAVGGPPARLELALRLGADHVVDLADTPAAEDRLAAVRGWLGERGADAVIGCVGHPDAFAQAIDFVADGGVVAEVGSFTDRGTTDFNPYSQLLRRNISIEGVYGAGPAMHERFLRGLAILERADLPLTEVVSHRVALSDVGEALKALTGAYRIDGRDVIKVSVDPSLP